MLTIRIQLKSIGSTKKRQKIKTNKRHQDQETKLLNKPISPKRFNEGRAAILQDLNKDHQKIILGIKLIKPLLIKGLRLLEQAASSNKKF
jgi:hypothetical protein